MSLQVNLLPREHRPKPAVRIWPVLLAIVLTINVVGMGSWWLFLQLDLAASITELAIKAKGVAQLEQQVQEAETAIVFQTEVQAKREFIDGVLTSSRCWHPFLESLELAMVPGVTINTITASDGGNVTLVGAADTIQSVTDFLGSLQVETALPVIRVINFTPGSTFTISMEGWSGREVQEVQADE